MLYLGVDPGLSGAVGAVNHRGEFVCVHDAPTVEIKKAKGKKRVYVESAMATILRDLFGVSRSGGTISYPGNPGIIIAVENVHAMPGQGVTSMFSMGFGMGLWLGIVAGLQIPYERVEPRVWKSKMGLATGADKGKSIILASQLFPTAPISLKKHDGRAESLLLAEWLRRKHERSPLV